MAVMRNGEGYYDPTAGNAIKAAVKGNTHPSAGEVWQNKAGDLFLVVTSRTNTNDMTRSNICIKVFSTKHDGNICILPGKYVDPFKVCYMTDDYLTKKMFGAKQLNQGSLAAITEDLHFSLFGNDQEVDKKVVINAELFGVLEKIAATDEHLRNVIECVKISFSSGRTIERALNG